MLLAEGVLFLGVLKQGAVLFGVYIRAPIFGSSQLEMLRFSRKLVPSTRDSWELPGSGLERVRKRRGFEQVSCCVGSLNKGSQLLCNIDTRYRYRYR